MLAALFPNQAAVLACGGTRSDRPSRDIERGNARITAPILRKVGNLSRPLWPQNARVPPAEPQTSHSARSRRIPWLAVLPRAPTARHERLENPACAARHSRYGCARQSGWGGRWRRETRDTLVPASGYRWGP